MPDDDKATEQEDLDTEKEETPDESEAAFSEDLEDEEQKSEKKEEEKVEDKDKKEPDKKPKKEAEREEEEPEKELSARDKLDKRLESVKDEEEEEEPPEKKEPEKKSEKESEKKLEGEPKPSALTKEMIAERLKLIGKDDLPSEVIIGDETVNLKQYAEDYPDDYAAIRVMSSVVAEKMIEKALEGVSYAKPEDVDTRIGDVEFKIAQLSFDSAVAQATDDKGNLKHPDYFNVTRGEGMKDFHAWVKEQSPKIQKLANSLEPEDGILILDYYKEDMAKKKTAEHDQKTRDKKKEYDDIYKSEKSVRKNQQEMGGSGKSEVDEAEEAFNEED